MMKIILRDNKRNLLKLKKNCYKKLLKKKLELEEKINKKRANNGRMQQIY